MYKTIATLLLIALNITFSTTFAQEFSFKQPATSTYTPSSSSNVLPKRRPTSSPEDFANSSTRAYQEQQAKVAAIAAELAKETQVNKARAEQAAAAKPAAGATQKPFGTVEQIINEPQKITTQPNPTAIASPTPAQTPVAPSTPAAQPYTGFQSPPPSTGGGSAPSNNNQNSGGWGSSIKY